MCINLKSVHTDNITWPGKMPGNQMKNTAQVTEEADTNNTENSIHWKAGINCQRPHMVSPCTKLVIIHLHPVYLSHVEHEEKGDQ
jgi:hypothetical protein